MSKIEVTDHAINYSPGPWGLLPTWGLTMGEKRIGTVWETETGYAGHIEGVTAAGKQREYDCPGMPFRQDVIDHLEMMAGRIGIA